jgi:SAM-dependent methyltransferase
MLISILGAQNKGTTRTSYRQGTANAHTNEFFSTIAAGSKSSALRVLGWLFAAIGTPASMIDIGCGSGEWVATARSLGVTQTVGVDGSYVDPGLLVIPLDLFHAHDLTQALDLGHRFDLAISMEVGEHLPASASETFVQSICRHSDVVLFSAAAKHQSRSAVAKAQHLNEQYPSYWSSIFEESGYGRIDIRGHIWADRSIEWWYRQNVFLYARTTTDLICLDRPPLDVIHPENLAETSLMIDRTLGVRESARSLAGAMKRRLMRPR